MVTHDDRLTARARERGIEVLTTSALLKYSQLVRHSRRPRGRPVVRPAESAVVEPWRVPRLTVDGPTDRMGS